MGRRGHAKRVFAGTNSAYGFYSFYEELLDGDAVQVFIVKGGPGTGKSSFMRKIAEDLLKHGYDVELLQCSADNESIDGFLAPALRVAMIDGTAPHVLDPKVPGVIEEIINLGDYWDAKALRAHRDRIVELTAANKACYPHATKYLAAAKIFYDEIGQLVEHSRALNWAALKLITMDLIQELFGAADRRPREAKERRRFASAITPDGFRNYLDSIFHPLQRRYVIKGHWGTGKSFVVRAIRDAALWRGWDLESYYCALDPQRLEHLVIPELGVGIITSELPHTYEPRNGDVVVDTAQAVDVDRLRKIQEDVNAARELYGRAVEQAIAWLARAKRYHDELEAYYTASMDFDGVEELRRRILPRLYKLET